MGDPDVTEYCCARCGRTPIKIYAGRPAIDPRYAFGRCPTHRSAILIERRHYERLFDRRADASDPKP